MKVATHLGALFLVACTATSADGPSTSADLATGPAHVDRLHHQVAAAGSTPTANYYGGKVISNPKVYVVYWGSGSNLLPALTKATGGIADFYAGVLDSPYMDGLTEYSTNRNASAGSHSGQPGSGQIIGRGNYAGTVPWTSIPSGATIDDAQLGTAIESAVASGALPTPDDNTLFAIYFPSSVTITIDNMTSCEDFGGYHEQTANKHIAYSVLPQCYNFAGMASVSSHELVEAVTDVVPTPGSNPDYPQAWNDSGGNELGDLCETSSGNYATAKGSFYVQTIWYESVKGCKITHAAATDFTVQGTSGTTAVAAGAPTTVTFKTATAGGAAQPLALSVIAPAGITATLSATTVTSGDTVTVSLTSDGTTSVKDGQIVLQAAGVGDSGPRSHAASVLVHTGS